ncbi:alpha-glucuronidase [Leifsonia sp. McL0607]|uniref:alpha-glucuronidase n=1 Tax=Leifsonia sp. McL0607 TaxID=3415672 RepID=UPI003CE99B1C
MSGDPFFATSDPCWLASALRHPVRERTVDVLGDGPLTRTVAGELEAIGAQRVSRSLRPGSDVVFGTIDALREAGVDPSAVAALTERCVDITGEGFVLHAVGETLYVTANGGRGLLYGFFRLLREPLLGDGWDAGLEIVESPVRPIRMLDHWDNMNADGPMGSVERGYAGPSIFFRDGRIVADTGRLVDYARLLASIGINAVAINNVNVHATEARLLVDHLADLTDVAAVFRRYGIALFVSVDFAAPLQVGGLATADPAAPAVQAWWAELTALVYRAIPDFGGYVVKADSEGRPGPFAYGRGHADGANLLARALRPFDGTLFWRCFVYDSQQDWRDRSTDRARAAHDHFAPLDGTFDDNVVLQVKAGPMDFQVREPVSPLLGALEATNLVVEMQITQEYTGHQIDLFYLPRTWEEVLRFDLDGPEAPPGGERTVAAVTASPDGARRVGMVAVSNVGVDPSWTGHPLAQANLYGFGRLAWSNEVSSSEILDEWIRLTFDVPDPEARALHEVIWQSPVVYEEYTAPLGVGWMVTPHVHYGPSVDGYEYSRWGTYHFADHAGIGVDRTVATGTGFAGQYAPGWADCYESPERCPDELLLFFHHVPYGHVLHSGSTVLQHIYDSHFRGVERVEAMVRTWGSLRGSVPAAVHAEVASRLDRQLVNARDWRDQVCTYFYRSSGIPDERGRRIY